MNYATLLIAIIVAIVPVSAALSAAWALYDWLVSRLPKNVQAVMIAHQAQIRLIITTVVDAVEQNMKGVNGAKKKAAAMDLATDIFASLPLPKSIPPPSPALIDALIEQSVAYLPKPKTPPPYTEPAKAASDVNPFIDVAPTKPWNGVVPSPLDAAPIVDAL